MSNDVIAEHRLLTGECLQVVSAVLVAVTEGTHLFLVVERAIHLVEVFFGRIGVGILDNWVRILDLLQKEETLILESASIHNDATQHQHREHCEHAHL